MCAIDLHQTQLDSTSLSVQVVSHALTLPYIACRLDLEQQQHPGASSPRQHDEEDGSSDSSDGSDCEEDNCSDMTGIRSSAVSISCENVRLQTHSGGTASTFSPPHRSVASTLDIAVAITTSCGCARSKDLHALNPISSVASLNPLCYLQNVGGANSGIM